MLLGNKYFFIVIVIVIAKKAKWQSMVMKYNNKQHIKQLAQTYCHLAYVNKQ